MYGSREEALQLHTVYKSLIPVTQESESLQVTCTASECAMKQGHSQNTANFRAQYGHITFVGTSVQNVATRGVWGYAPQ